MRAADEYDLMASFLALEEPDRPREEWRRYGFTLARRQGEYVIDKSREDMVGVDISVWDHKVPSPGAPLLHPLHSLQRPSAREDTSLLRLRTEMVTLRHEIAALRDEHDRLREQLQRLECRLDEAIPVASSSDAIPIDPHTRWMQDNVEMLRNYPNEWIALHAVRGILFHTADGDEFASALDRLSPEERDEVLAFHSSMYF